MRILVDALATTNLSGRHVLLGHLERAARATVDRDRFILLVHSGNADFRERLGNSVEWRECPPITGHWLGRRMWQSTSMAGVVRATRADAVLTVSGTTLPAVTVPQVVYAMNPWSLVPGLHRTPTEHLKAAFQRWAYRRAMADADGFLFLSKYLRELYRRASGRHERCSEIVYCGIDDATFAAARGPSRERLAHQIVCVSAMAPHKDLETLLHAVASVRRAGVPATLRLVGPWPDLVYRRSIDQLIARLDLQPSVSITGWLPSIELRNAYAESRVFALLSRAESFGIPAVEAQAFGTPVIGSTMSAMAEVCGAGGMFAAPGNVGQATDLIGTVLTRRETWTSLSEAAVLNARRFTWDACAETFVMGLERILRPGAAPRAVAAAR
jgi:glycosyltransferase involved in cell wall biosynthesis